MNLLLLLETDFITPNQALINDRRSDHIKQIHQANIGRTLNIGILNKKMGTAIIERINNEGILLNISIKKSPPAPLPLTLIIALPRPKMLKRILQTCATMGVKKIIFMNSFRVEKSYWQTPLLQEERITEQLILGLEQGKDTLLPEVILEKRFKPFVEDRLGDIGKNTLTLVAHPNSDTPCPQNISTPTTLIIGPEGGFIPYEIEKLQTVGCTPIHIGERILRVETAIPVLLGKIFS
jgi:16S rRNA (uracil1498-N3)-methyltransferase